VVIVQGFKLALLGIAIGLLVALLVTHLLTSLLYDVSAKDPLIFLAIPEWLQLDSMISRNSVIKAHSPQRRRGCTEDNRSLGYPPRTLCVPCACAVNVNQC
jgi:predicted lysophospholipase L1 biosynthesis ABC-type transport system permease subunit